MPDIKPLEVLQNDNELSKLCHRIGAPVFLIKSGNIALVVMSIGRQPSSRPILKTPHQKTTPLHYWRGVVSFLLRPWLISSVISASLHIRLGYKVISRPLCLKMRSS